MATGKVLQFDPDRGYGFVAADDGGEDVFLHASVFDGNTSELIPGLPLEFQVMAGDRGRKAFAAHCTGEVKGQLTAPKQAVRTTETFSTADEDQMCDVLSQSEFGTELTELLLNTLPALTGPQILELRTSMLLFAKKRGWVDV